MILDDDGRISGETVISDNAPLEQAMTPAREEGLNPKDRAGQGKVPLGILPAAGKIHGALAAADGARKYGPYNWRQKPIRATIYLDAIERHLLAYRDGEDIDKSGINHLGHIIAGASILLDAIETGNAIDDRPADGVAAALLDEHAAAA